MNRVLVSAVYKKTTNLKLRFFSNHPEIDKVTREQYHLASTANGADESSGKA